MFNAYRNEPLIYATNLFTCFYISEKLIINGLLRHVLPQSCLFFHEQPVLDKSGK